MQSSGKMACLACVVAAAALAAGCVPAINYGSPPPEPEITTCLTTTTRGTTTRKPFTTRKHSAHTISWAEYSGEYKKSTTTGHKGTDSAAGTHTGGTQTGTGTGLTGTGVHGTGTGTGTGAAGESIHIPDDTDMPQSVTQTVKPDEPVVEEPVETQAPVVTEAPHEDPPPQTDAPQTAAPQPPPQQEEPAPVAAEE